MNEKGKNELLNLLYTFSFSIDDSPLTKKFFVMFFVANCTFVVWNNVEQLISQL